MAELTRRAKERWSFTWPEREIRGSRTRPGLTGFDTRYDDEGAFRTLDVLVPEVLEVCRR